MSPENPFLSPLGKLALSLGASDSSSSDNNNISPQLSQRRQICTITLLRIIDNILDDPNQSNPKLRKIKVSNAAFHKRCGQWDGSIDYLLQCGFKLMKGNHNTSNNSSSSSSRQLRLDVDDRELLLYGREMLVQFAVLTLGVEESSLPKRSVEEVEMNGMKESHNTDDNNAKPVHENIKPNNDRMDSKPARLDPAVDNELPSRKLSTIVEHSVSHAVSDKNEEVKVASRQEQPIESTRTDDTQIVDTSLPAAAPAQSPSTDNQILKEEEEHQSKEETAPENNEESTDDMMTDLLNEIEAELNDDFFSPPAKESTAAQEALVPMNSDTKDASPQEDSMSVRSTEVIISNMDDEDTDDLAKAIAMSLLSGSDSDKDESDNDGGRSNSKSLLQHNGEDAIISPSQEPSPALERTVAQSSDIMDNIISNDSLVTRQEIGGDSSNVVEPPPTRSDERNSNDNDDDSCKGHDEVVEQDNVASLQTDSESDKKSKLNGTSHEESRISPHNKERRSSLRTSNTSMSSLQTLQMKNTSAQPQDGDNGVATVVKEYEATMKVDRSLPAAAEDQTSQSHEAQSDCTNVFGTIPISEGEYEDAKIFRLGFELCHRSVFSIWPQSELASVSGVSNLQRWKKGEPNSTNDLDPVILVPLHLVYAVWTYILELQSKSSHHSTKNDGRAHSGSMYKWIVSNNKELSTLGDIPATKLSMNIHTNLSESNISVCNYVLNALRGIGIIDIYGGNVIGSPPSDKTVFIGVERSVCEEYTSNYKDSSILSEPIIRDCHDILAQVVYPTVLDQLDDDPTSNNNCDKTLMWYAVHHAPRHLMAVPRMSDAKGMLLDGNFVRARLHCMGYVEGTKQHCQDCADLANCLSRLDNDWKRTQLRSADTRQDECVMAPEDYNDYDCSVQAPELPEWTESRVKALCAVSNILREKVGKVSEHNKDAKVEIGNSLQGVGEAIGDIGIYCVEELEHYDEALQLKSEALGDKHEEVAETLFAMGCHHQRFQHSAFAQKCYEQTLAIYKARLGYDDPKVAGVLHNIGVLYHSKNESSVAMKCFVKSLSIRRDTLGDNDISVAESHCWIGNLHRENEEFEAARQSFLAAHRIKSVALGNGHPECAEILHNIGVVCDDLGLYSESLSSFREALVIRKANASSAYDVNEMSDICDTLNCIANVYRAKMDRQRALKFFEQSLTKRAKIVSTSLSDNDQVPILLSTYEDVIALMKIELKESVDKREITEKIGSLLVEMALLYDHRLSKSRKALTYFQRSLQVFKRTKDLKRIGQVLSHMASIHVKNADNQKALKCFRDALVLEKKLLKGESLEMADTLHNIGNCEAKEGEFEKCLDTYAESLRMKKKILPGAHASIAKTEHCIGLAQMQAGNLEKALGYFLSSIKARRSLLGNSHLDTSFSLHR